MKKTSSKKGFYASMMGTVAVALCCFTPILVIAVGVLGLGTLTPYLDYVLYPALMVMIVVTILSYGKYKKGCCSVSTTTDESVTKNTMETAILTCPFCAHAQEIEIPQTGCLAFHKCEECEELISVPKESTNCCVICEYADKKCPVAR